MPCAYKHVIGSHALHQRGHSAEKHSSCPINGDLIPSEKAATTMQADDRSRPMLIGQQVNLDQQAT